MLWIGLTGGIASGKSTVSHLLRARGFAVIDADQLAREVVQIGTSGYDEVVQAFGRDAILASGELNRKKIGEIVFSDRAMLDVLEKIIHPRVRSLAQQRRRELEEQGREISFYDVPLLFEKKMEALFDRVAVVACSRARQLERLMARDGLPKVEAERRLSSQMPIDEKVRRADFVIRNDGTSQELEREVDACVARLRALHQAQT